MEKLFEGDGNLYLKKVLSLTVIDLYYNSVYHDNIWFKIPSVKIKSLWYVKQNQALTIR